MTNGVVGEQNGKTIVSDAIGTQNEQIGRLAFDVGCMKSDKQIADIRLNGFEKWLSEQADYADVLDVFKMMVRNEFKGTE